MVGVSLIVFCFKGTATTEFYTLSRHDALPIWVCEGGGGEGGWGRWRSLVEEVTAAGLVKD